MTRVCVNCGGPADTMQHLLPKAITSPVDYIRLALCTHCHNYGKNSAESVAQRLINNLELISEVQITTVNGKQTLAIAGSAAPGQTIVVPSGAFQASFVNKNTGFNNDFSLIRTGTRIAASGNSLGEEYVGFVFLVTQTQR